MSHTTNTPVQRAILRVLLIAGADHAASMGQLSKALQPRFSSDDQAIALSVLERRKLLHVNGTRVILTPDGLTTTQAMLEVPANLLEIAAAQGAMDVGSGTVLEDVHHADDPDLWANGEELINRAALLVHSLTSADTTATARRALGAILRDDLLSQARAAGLVAA